MKTIIIEYRDRSHAIRYQPEPPEHSYWIREWIYKDVPDEVIKEIRAANIKRVEQILTELYER